MDDYRERRRPTESEAWITAGATSKRVQLKNVSRRGLAVNDAPKVPPGTLCRVEKGPLTVFATVRWRRGDTMGLSLAQPLTDKDAAVFGIGR